MSLADSVIQTANQGISDQGHTAADALNAYHVASSAENARQELEMEKSNHEMNKANWTLNSLASLGKMSPELQQIAAPGISKQISQMYPNANPDILTALQKDHDFRLKAFQAAAPLVSGGGVQTSDGAASIANLFGGDLVSANQTLEHIGQQRATVAAAQLKNQALEGRVGAMQDNATQAAADKFDKDPNIQKLVPMGQSLGRDAKTLQNNDPKHPVTYQTLHESLMNVANVLGSGSLSDSRVNSITPSVSDEMKAKIESFMQNNPNQAADPKYVDYVQHLVGRLNQAINADVADRAHAVFQGRDAGLFHNPGIGAAMKAKHQEYTSGAWRNQISAPLVGQAPTSSSQSAAPSAAPTGAPAQPPHGQTVIQGGHTYTWNAATGKYE